MTPATPIVVALGGSRCKRCFWALHDGTFCQNPDCARFCKRAGKRYRFVVDNEDVRAMVVARLRTHGWEVIG